MRARIAAAEGLTPDDLREMLPSGRQPVFANRVGWAVTYMTRAGLLERVHRAVYRLTDEGGRLLACKHSRVDLDVLRTYPAFVEWSRNANAPSPVKDTTVPVKPHEPAETPEETLDLPPGTCAKRWRPMSWIGSAKRRRRSSNR